MSLYLSRLTLSRAPSVEALKRLIDPEERGRAQDAHHRLLWSAFAGDPDAPRDFLWRSEGNGRFFVLSRRRPADSPFFDQPEVKDFAPALAPGDRLDFVLRANATRTRKTGETTASGKERRKHDDVVMHAIRDLPKGARAEARMAAAGTAGRAWLEGQGTRAGFAVELAEVADYSVVALPDHRGPRRGQPQFGVLDLSGVIRLEDPALFLDRMAQGFGRAKSFGHGLMMIRRARPA
ncbi:type I-E CRISPR-associated protein Cas6/Cse3/CasE [Paracoccus sp. YIM 132242]|uniref:Type I-E CRISPR-associated protein Cas6/Cse3/CasE n=1 Tax=Paracoccus lichenicola TaxID=2665644 RepID=A0A6L6HNZ8_9RHOB|nr:type I-E CRISPR-associated protein Cas6/Cse3/CasE [Paracoccus lichenicola]MTD99784.1 type I-E CRISPR-associated protein Cas6/Cse3/CasE [Paracoccus lichenicola]